MLHLHDDHLHHTHTEEELEALAQSIWRQESVELNTVGIDIGSSTSHLLFSNVLLQRRAQGLSSRFVVTRREIVWKSPIIITPFLDDGTIDAPRLEAFIHECYRRAGYEREDIDSGAVILTGEAMTKKNAPVIDELFAEEAGKFVCATAGHKLESVLAAHGSGAVRLSKDSGICLLHVDVGGGTTKIALIDRGRILDVAAFAVGGRVLAADDSGGWTRIDDPARLVARDLGMQLDTEAAADPEVRQAIAKRLADIAVDFMTGGPVDKLGMELQLTELLERSREPEMVTFSGGVSEYILGRETAEYGDIAMPLAAALRAALEERFPCPLGDAGNGIRATVIGASQFTVQVSGKTIYLSTRDIVPIHNVPVVLPDIALGHAIDAGQVSTAIRTSLSKHDLAATASVAVAIKWEGDPSFQRLEALGSGIRNALAPDGRRQSPLLLVIDGDIGSVLGHVLQNEIGLIGDLISIDGIDLEEFDYVDVGEVMDPPGVVPVVIKSLLFS